MLTSQWTHSRRIAIDSTSRGKLFGITSILKGESSWNYDIDATWKFNVDSTLRIGGISMSSPRGFFDAVSTSTRRNFCTRCFHCIIL